MISIQAPSSHKDNHIALPGSKYVANRLLILAALTRGTCEFHNVPDNDDIATAMAGLRQVGASFEKQGSCIKSQGIQTEWPEPAGSIYTSHSGTFSRFMVAVAALSHDWVAMNGSDKMNSRPMADLFQALREAGVEIDASEGETLPARIRGPIKAETIRISGTISSQYISGLLLVAAALPQGLTIELTSEPVSKPYLAMTIDLLDMFDIKVTVSDNYRHFHVAAGQCYQPVQINVPADPSSASYFLAYAAITATHLCIQNFQPDLSLQGEADFFRVLEKMGCEIWEDEDGFHCLGPQLLSGVEVDMGDMPDVVQTLAVVAAFAEGETLITNIENLAFKESNRIEDTATELRKTGLVVETTAESIRIIPCPLNAATFDTYDDHRMAMSLALLGGRIEGIRMNDPEVVSKSFPAYWHYLQQLGFEITEMEQS